MKIKFLIVVSILSLQLALSQEKTVETKKVNPEKSAIEQQKAEEKRIQAEEKRIKQLKKSESKLKNLD